jgi:saxitoxin biosynthesis operon SxtJ-like protein
MAQTHEDFSRGQQVKASSDRAFGWTFVTVFLVIALWPLAVGGALRWWSLIASGLVLAATVAAPSLLALPNRLWQRFGLLLHRIVSPIVLAIMFYLVITPTGLLMRVFAKNILRLRRESAAETYWIKREPPGPRPDSMPRQF